MHEKDHLSFRGGLYGSREGPRPQREKAVVPGGQ
jgi:hypothetical protein